jgi:hypothetical protein
MFNGLLLGMLVRRFAELISIEVRKSRIDCAGIPVSVPTSFMLSLLS